MSLLPLGDVVRPALVLLASTLAVWLLMGLVLRDARRGAACASVLLVHFFSFGPASDLARAQGWIFSVGTGAELLPVWIPVTCVFMALAGWKWKNPLAVTRILNLAGLTLAGLTLWSLASGALSIHSSLARLDTTGHKAQGSAAQGTPPDIFYIILDGCGRADALEQFLHFSGHEFVNQLESRGFYVAKRSHSNYCQTELSLASSLNMGYLPEFLGGLHPEDTNRAPFEQLVSDNAVASFLKSKGYAYVSITTGFPGIRPQGADLDLAGPQGLTLLESSLLARTPLAQPDTTIRSAFDTRRDKLLAAFDHLEGLGRGGQRPRFVFAHILAPHPPFVLGPNGEPRRPRGPFTYADANAFQDIGGTPQEYADGYRDQFRYTQKRILAAVDAILRTESQRPIILIQGDHGSKLTMDQESLDKTDVRECFRNMSCYLVPDSMRARLYPEITPVNSFRLIFSELFRANLPLLSDRSYFSPYNHPQDLTEVTAIIEDAPADTKLGPGPSGAEAH